VSVSSRKSTIELQGGGGVKTVVRGTISAVFVEMLPADHVHSNTVSDPNECKVVAEREVAFSAIVLADGLL
jgi:hypothetical protein